MVRKQQAASRGHLSLRSVRLFTGRLHSNELTAEKVPADTPLPHVKAPPEIAQLPFEVDMVKLEEDPESVYVAGVWTDQVPAVSRPPEPALR